MFFDTLRVEFGSEIKITIVTPGFIESELTQGKFLAADGKMKVDQDLGDVSTFCFIYAHFLYINIFDLVVQHS